MTNRTTRTREERRLVSMTRRDGLLLGLSLALILLTCLMTGPRGIV